MAKPATLSPEFVRNVTSEVRQQLWQTGVDLRGSPEWFAAPESIQHYRSLGPATMLDWSAAAEETKRAGGGFLAAMQALQPQLEGNAERRQAWQAMQLETASRLGSGELLGLGFVLPRQVDDAPGVIPQDVWGGWIKWDAGTVSGEGLEFVSVRIIAPEATAGLLLPAEADQDQPRPVGRPSVKVEVVRAYEALKAEGKIDFSKPMNALYQPIREWLAIQYVDRNAQFLNLGKETIRKEIAAQFKADKAAQEP